MILTIFLQSVGYPIVQLHHNHSRNLALLNAELIQDEGHANDMSLPELEERMSQWLKSADYICYAVMHHCNVVSYCLWRCEPSHIHVRQLFTLRNYRRKGLASKLLEYLRENTEDQRPIRLEVLASNHAAQKFYEKHGFSLYSHTYQK